MIQVKSHKRVRKNGVTIVRRHSRKSWEVGVATTRYNSLPESDRSKLSAISDMMANERKKQAAKMQAAKKPKTKVQKVMHEWKSGTLHSGSKKGPIVKNPKQAIAIAISEQKKAKR